MLGQASSGLALHALLAAEVWCTIENTGLVEEEAEELMAEQHA